LPPKPKDTPAGRLYHFGALSGTAQKGNIRKRFKKASIPRAPKENKA